jgi:hypothetical protein
MSDMEGSELSAASLRPDWRVSKVGTDPNFFCRICRLLSVFPRHTVTATVINLIVT